MTDAHTGRQQLERGLTGCVCVCVLWQAQAGSGATAPADSALENSLLPYLVRPPPPPPGCLQPRPLSARPEGAERLSVGGRVSVCVQVNKDDDLLDCKSSYRGSVGQNLEVGRWVRPASLPHDY